MVAMLSSFLPVARKAYFVAAQAAGFELARDAS